MTLNWAASILSVCRREVLIGKLAVTWAVLGMICLTACAPSDQVPIRHGGNPNLQRGQNDIHDEGAYLKAVFGGQRRIAGYSSRLQAIAIRM